jgi:hypothetical protein
VGVEALEARRLPSLSVLFADGVGVSGTGSADVESNAVAEDASGKVYVTGSLVGTANFNPGGTTNLTSAGSRDVFLAKYAKSGALVWAKDLPGANASTVAQGAAIVVDTSGNVTIAGTFTGTVNFDPNGGTTSATAAGRNDVFVARYAANGNLVWAKDIPGSSGSYDQAYSLALDGSGDVAVAGSFQGTATFGTTTLTAGGYFDSFVAVLNPSGQFTWASGTSGSGSSNAQAAGVTYDGSGDVISTGLYSGTVNFNPGPGATNLTSAGSNDVFVQKLDPTGKLVWAEGFGSYDVDQGNGVAADSAGNVYVTGMFADTVNFNPGPGTNNLTAGGLFDGFLLKLNSAGQYVWADDFALSNYRSAQPTGVGLDGLGHVVVAGLYQGTMTFPGGSSLTSAGDFDAFAAAFDTSGNYVAGRSLGGANFDAASGVGVNANGLVAVTGRYTGPATFGTTALPTFPGKSIFIAQLQGPAPPPPSAPPAPALEPGSDTGASQSDGITKDQVLTFDVGTVPSGNTVELLRDGSVVATRTGPGPVTDPGPVPEGRHGYTAIQIDSNSQSSPASATTTVVVDITPPATPARPTLLAQDDSGTLGDGITNVNMPRLTGTTEAGATVQLLSGPGTVIGTITAGSNGAYTVQPSARLADGTYSLTVQAVDVAGNISLASPALSLTIDTTPPVAPSTPVLLPADDSGVKGDGITNVKQPHFTGTAEAGATVQLRNATGAVIGSTTAGSDGSFTVQVGAPLADGPYTFSAVAIDAAGNVGPPGGTVTVTIQAAPPAAPAAAALLAADDAGPLGDGKTVIRQPWLTGTTTPGWTVDLLDVSGNVVSTSVAAAGSGTYLVKPASPLSAGTYPFRVRVHDLAGNVSAPSPAFNLTIVDASPGDFDGDGKTDLGVFRPSTAQWLIADSSGGSSASTFGGTNYVTIPVPADYDGIGRSEYAVFLPSTAQWVIAGTAGGKVVSFGGPNLMDIPVPGDYDGVGHAEIAVFRPSTAQWFVLQPNGRTEVLGPFGATGLFDIPVPADYDGVGHAELAVFRPSTAQWFILGPSGVRAVSFGGPNLMDIPVPGDYDGVGHAEFAVFRPSTAQWFILGPSGVRAVSYGGPHYLDIPLVAPIGSLVRLGVTAAKASETIAAAVAGPPAVDAAPVTAGRLDTPDTSARHATAPAPARRPSPSRPAQSVRLGHVDQAIASLFDGDPPARRRWVSRERTRAAH